MLKRTLVIVVVLSLLTTPFLMSKDFATFYRKSMECYQNDDYQGFLDNTRKALKMNPGSFRARYNLACASSLTGNKQDAIGILNELIEKGYGLNADGDGDFDPIRETDEFKKILKKIKEKKKPYVQSETAFVVKENDLIPEGIAYDPVDDCFYLGSIYKSKIVKIEKDGKVSDFVKSRQDGILCVLGMRVDKEKHHLWACNCFGYPREDLPRELFGTAEIMKYDLKTSKLIKRYSLPMKDDHFINDVVVAKNGTVYMTNSHQPGVYFIDPEKDEIARLVDLPNAGYPNGIDISPDEKLLFVAYGSGILTVNLETLKISELTSPDNGYIGGCDGLYFYENSLIGIQNGQARIIRLYLNSDYTKVKEFKYLESYNPEFRNPTTGAIRNDEFYFIGTSHLRALDNKGKLHRDRLTDIKILKLKLDK